MSSRVCTGCGRRVRGDLGVCLACGSDVHDDVVVSTVTTDLPPAPAVALPVWAAPAPDLPAWGPPVDAALRRPLGPGTAITRLLAVAGHVLIAACFGVTTLVTIVTMLGRPRWIAADDVYTGYLAGIGIGCLLGVVYVGWIGSRARRLVGVYDWRKFRNAVPGDVVVILLPLAGFVLTGSLLSLALLGLTMGVTVVTGITAVMLSRAYARGA